MITLREFAYYDRRKIEDFIDGIEGGLSRETKEIKRETGREIEGGIPNIVKGKARHKEIESEELIEKKDASLFNKLYTYLIETKMITEVEKLEDIENKFQIGDFLEIKGTISISGFEKFFEKYQQVVPLMKTLPTYKENKDKIDTIINYCSVMASREIINIKIIPINNMDDNTMFISPISQKNMTVSTKSELEGNYNILGRVREVLNKDKKFKFFDYIPGIALNEEQALQIINSFSRGGFGLSLKKDDLEISSPAVIITPIAIYR